ncbi:MAG: bifunctional D-glycero-beta-D-manno-heptose-7-phosphate kinase/D-glycero-beta-D-manno-heptose 1-phosphate adenylyltransferase HldE [Desulfobacterales bacterium]|nr:bifunctional D-glycero-beta-D-manno-heptose-7-phosphate kinase/D-glycero-beta-D-manno-heptose 1-phosphate adenylyltransferase HldE [Desulfobacterales bacterium]
MKSYSDFSHCRVVVVGDVMLDVYFWGEVVRISPEAPVPVVRVREKSRTLGGAGNVALNLAGLKCQTTLIGVCGDDFSGGYLSEILMQKGIVDNLIKNPTQPTTTKTRIIGQGQQLLRLDEEEIREISEDINRRLMHQLGNVLDTTDVVILSDYGKGLFKKDLAQKIICACRQRQVPVFVDPKGKSWQRYEGATCITPNWAEFQAVLPETLNDEQNFDAQAKEIIDQLNLQFLMVTRGPRGLSLFGHPFMPLHIPTQVKEVFDVSGAGDTVIATLAAAYGSGLPIAQAAEWANIAAGIVVGKLGTQPIHSAELKAAVRDKKIVDANKFCSLIQAKNVISAWKSEGKRIVFTNGCFDLLHIGHIKLLQASAEKGDKLVIGLNSDSSVRRLKGNSRPIIPEEERAALLSSISCVDLVVLFDEDTPIELIRAFQPDFLVKGGDYTAETVVGHDIIGNWGGTVVLIPLVAGVSTTKVIESVKTRDNAARP